MTTRGLQAVDYKTPSEEVVQDAISKAIAGYKRVFGRRLAQVWLFGSRARGDHRPDSDVDLLVVLHEHGLISEEVRSLCSVELPIQLSHGVFIQGHPTRLEWLETSDDDFHYFVKCEGRRVDG